ncbi:leucine/isoleucine/valine transporter permease subunit [Serratia rubidaea]|uniref:Leucine/isoleucine/valine transporter permease subunit n=1 Tax=Serratia rubidaea TaxID=61652 RepID=A0A4U9HAQ7_SERRU|nr:leucine/isoleucine/valine transporter permease subunit [Serratia rubidaea]
MKLNLLNALIAAAVLFVMAAFLMGMQLGLDGTKLVVRGAAEVRWMWIGIGCALVFVFQLLRPLLQQGLSKVSGRLGCCRVLTAPRRDRNCWRRC